MAAGFYQEALFGKPKLGLRGRLRLRRAVTADRREPTHAPASTGTTLWKRSNALDLNVQYAENGSKNKKR